MALHILVLCLANKLRALEASLVIIQQQPVTWWYDLVHRCECGTPKSHPVPKWLGHNNGSYIQGAIHHPSSCQFVRHAVFFGLPSFCMLEPLRVPLWQVWAERRMDGLTPTHKILTSLGKVQRRLFSHISSIVHLGLTIWCLCWLCSRPVGDERNWTRDGDLVQYGLGIPTTGFSRWLHYRIFGPGMSGFQEKS
jgi:hypothetical protein